MKIRIIFIFCTFFVVSRAYCDILDLCLPEVIYACPGIEANIYFDNVTLTVNPANFVFDVECKKGIQQKERWTLLPTEEDIGDHLFKITIKDQSNTVFASQSATIRVISTDLAPAKTLTLLCVGDSLTHASVYTGHILDLAHTNKTGPQIKLIGTHCPKDAQCINRHEGYGGWKAEHFVNRNNGTPRTGYYKNRASPFLYKNSKDEYVLNFKKYCQEVNNGFPPDVVTFFLGANDVFSADDQTINDCIDTMLSSYDRLIQMIHSLDKNITIGLFLPVPPAASQDAFGKNAACGQTRWQYKRNIHFLVKKILNKYSDLENRNIYLIPANVNLDCVHNYPAVKVSCNSRTTKTIIRMNNALHPADSGYKQIGDTLYSWLISISQKSVK